MKPVTADELLDLVAYEREREGYRQRVIELKRPRRIRVGDELCFLFENRETVRFQVQEMLRTERIVRPERIQAELEVYNELVPRDDQLSATLMIEITESEQIRPTLDRLIGIDERVFLDVGESAVRARFDARQLEEERISAVHYLSFALGPELSRRFRDASTPVALRVEHPHYRARTPIEGASRASLTADLS